MSVKSATRAMNKLAIGDIPAVDTVVKKISTDLLEEASKSLSLPFTTAAKARQYFREEIEAAGAKRFVTFFNKNELVDLIKGLDINLEENASGEARNPKSKSVMAKRYAEAIVNTGVETYFVEKAKDKQISLIAEVLGLKEATKPRELIAAQVSQFGMEIFFSRIPENTLIGFAKDMGLELRGSGSQSLIRAIVTMSDIPKPARREVVTEVKEPKKIELGVSKEQLNTFYTLDELVEWCRESELKVSGTKKEVIKRILAFLDGDVENTKAVNTEKKAETKKKAEPKKAEPKKKAETKKKADTKKAAAEEPEEEVEEKSTKKTEDKRKSTGKKPVEETPEEKPVEDNEMTEAEEPASLEDLLAGDIASLRAYVVEEKLVTDEAAAKKLKRPALEKLIRDFNATDE